MAVRDIYVSGDGDDTRDGRTWADRVRTFRRARQLASTVAAADTVSFVVGQFNMSREASFSQRLGKGIGDFDVPDGWTMRAYDPALPWHFTDLDALNLTSDFVQVYRSGDTYNAATTNCPNVTNNNGVPTGSATGVWVTTRDVARAAKPLYRVARVWRGGSPLTIGSAAAVPSAYDPYNELWEARQFSTLGQDGTHAWTQLTPPEAWPANDVTDSPTPVGGRLFLYSPKGNPATVWGGITVLAQRCAAEATVNELGFLTIQQSAGWHVDESIRAMGGGIGGFRIRGNCTDARFEARVDVMSPYYPVVELEPLGAADTFTAIEVSPRWDMRVAGKPYYEVDTKHSTGQSDALQIGSRARVTGLLVRGRTSAGGELCYVRDPGHAAIGRPVPAAGIVLDGLVVEREFSVYCGGMQYQRAFGISGTKETIRNCTLSGRIFGQRAPSQVAGNIRVVGAEFHHGGQIIPAAPENSPTYPSRFNDDPRNWSNLHPDGKNRDCTGLVVGMVGVVEVRDCVFNSVHGPAIRIGSNNNGSTVTRQPDETCLVENCTFVNGAVPGSQRTAILLDNRGNAPSGVSLVDNVAVGYAGNGGAQRTTNGFDRVTARLEDLGTGASPVARNVGWRRAAYADCFG